MFCYSFPLFVPGKDFTLSFLNLTFGKVSASDAFSACCTRQHSMKQLQADKSMHTWKEHCDLQLILTRQDAHSCSINHFLKRCFWILSSDGFSGSHSFNQPITGFRNVLVQCKHLHGTEPSVCLIKQILYRNFKVKLSDRCSGVKRAVFPSEV